LFIKRLAGEEFHQFRTVLFPVYFDAQLREQDRESSDALPRLGLHSLRLLPVSNRPLDQAAFQVVWCRFERLKTGVRPILDWLP
jgi:hypothetical protein